MGKPTTPSSETFDVNKEAEKFRGACNVLNGEDVGNAFLDELNKKFSRPDEKFAALKKVADLSHTMAQKVGNHAHCGTELHLIYSDPGKPSPETLTAIEVIGYENLGEKLTGTIRLEEKSDPPPPKRVSAPRPPAKPESH